MIFVFYALALLLIYFSYRSLIGGVAYLRFFRTELAKTRSNYTPFVTVIAPCRGVDKGMDENLAAFVEQDHPGYEVVFVVDDASDPAVPVIEKLTSTAAVPTRLVVAHKAVGSGQKVENLREAVLHADERSHVFVFVDSDTRPLKTWLRDLIAPLENDDIGAATGYRWFISETPTFASEMRSVWNASIASALGPNSSTNFCWGGSMAIRRDIFERIGMRDKWVGTLSDDFAMTRVLNEEKLPIVFVPQALTASVETCTWREMLEFTTRQMKITRVYAQPLWILSFFGSGLFNAVMISAFLIAALSSRNSFAVWFSITTIAIVSICSVGKAWLRLRAVELVLTGHAAALRRQYWTQNTLWLLTPAVFLYNCIAALMSRKMTWRGIRYELKSPTETVIISGVTSQRD